MSTLPIELLMLAALSTSPTTPWEDPHPHRTAPPLRVTVSGQGDAGALELVVRLHRPAPDAVPMTLRVQVPKGTEVLSGRLDETIVDDAQTIVTRVVIVKLPRVIEDDITVTAEARTSAWGAMAEARYQLVARAPVKAPRVSGPVLRGPAGRQLGRPVPLVLGR